MSPPAVLLTGVGKRYDIVSAFAQHTRVVACDPNPLSPAQYAATVRTAVPLIKDPDYVPALQRLVAEHDVGAILRRYSIDELPNLVNVLKGEMSIIGPRPTVPVQVAQYTDRQRGRLALKPGITGWAQVNGRASLPWPQRIELDLWYVEHATLLLDLKILWLTARMLVTGHGLYKGETGGWVDPR